jgi:hypothetical protein
MEFNSRTGDVMRSVYMSFSAESSTEGLARFIARA